MIGPSILAGADGRTEKKCRCACRPAANTIWRTEAAHARPRVGQNHRDIGARWVGAGIGLGNGLRIVSGDDLAPGSTAYPTSVIEEGRIPREILAFPDPEVFQSVECLLEEASDHRLAEPAECENECDVIRPEDHFPHPSQPLAGFDEDASSAIVVLVAGLPGWDGMIRRITEEVGDLIFECLLDRSIEGG